MKLNKLEFKIYGATLDGEDIRNYKNSDSLGEKRVLILEMKKAVCQDEF